MGTNDVSHASRGIIFGLVTRVQVVAEDGTLSHIGSGLTRSGRPHNLRMLLMPNLMDAMFRVGVVDLTMMKRWGTVHFLRGVSGVG